MLKIRYEHKESAPAASTASVDLDYLKRRQELLERDIAELSAAIDKVERAQAEHPLRLRISRLEGYAVQTQLDAQAEIMELQTHTAQDSTRQHKLDSFAKLLEALESESAALEDGYNKVTQDYLKARKRLMALMLESKNEADGLKAEQAAMYAERSRRARDVRDAEQRGLNVLSTQIKGAKKQLNADMHKPAKKARELARKREKLSRRLEALKADIAKFAQAQEPEDAPQGFQPPSDTEQCVDASL